MVIIKEEKVSEKFDINNINKNVYNIGKLTSDIIEILDCCSQAIL